MAAMKRLVAVVAAACVLSGGCTYAKEEPGLFRNQATSSPTAETQRPPAPTNPELPVAAEAEWTTAEGLHISTRFAIHAVRRLEVATIVDWSVTPLSAPGYGPGDNLPSWVDLGLSRTSEGDVNMFLIDPSGDKIYRTLSHQSRRLFNRCLCTPLWLAQQGMRMGETRMLQATFPPLPDALSFIDVDLINSAPFVHIPVTPIGQVPTALHPTDLVRPPDTARSPLGQRVFRYGQEPHRVQSITINRVVVAPGRTSLEWTIKSITDQSTFILEPALSPIGGELPDGVDVLNRDVVSGPQIRPQALPPAKVLRVSWLTTAVAGRKAYECLCSSLGLWAGSLRRAGGEATVTSNFPPLPSGTRTVDVILPEVATISGVPVVDAEDLASRLGPAEPYAGETWIYDSNNPPRGWTTAEWPTPLPDQDQLKNYRFFVEILTRLPGW
ncbi:MAG TPA: hypothetical protein VNB87_12450 [Propionibacteriaceae bacterium]|jgi:hypothetical protein|nr:hypothetical protein [Propionibacteriaceae bacterium]